MLPMTFRFNIYIQIEHVYLYLTYLFNMYIYI